MRRLTVLVVLLAGACAAGRPADNTPAGALPPFPDPKRTPSGFSITYPYPLGSEFTAGHGATADGDNAQLAPPAGDFAWATYFMANGNGKVLKYYLNYTVNSGEMWFAMADFDAMRWELHGPYTGSGPTEVLVDERHYTARRDLWCAVIVPGGGDVTVAAVKPRIDYGSIAEQTVASGLGSAGMVSLAVVGGRPAIAFRDEAGNRIRCAVARVADPQIPADWAVSTISSSGTPGGYNDIADLNGKPVVSYSVESGGDLFFAYANTSTPESAGDWSVEAVDTARDAQYEHALAVCNGMPIVSYFEPDPGDGDGDSVLGYLRAAVPTGGAPGSGWSSYRIADCGADSCLPAMADKNGNAATAYWDGSGGIRYIESDGNHPLSEQDWTSFNQPIANGVDYPLRVAIFNGRPAVFYAVPYVQYMPMVYEALALTDFPAEQGQWQSSAVQGSAESERQFDVAVFNGKLVFADQRYVDSSPPYPSYWEVEFWRYPQATSSMLGTLYLQLPVLQTDSKSSHINVAIQSDAAIFAYYSPANLGKLVFSRNVYP